MDGYIHHRLTNKIISLTDISVAPPKGINSDRYIRKYSRETALATDDWQLAAQPTTVQPSQDTISSRRLHLVDEMQSKSKYMFLLPLLMRNAISPNAGSKKRSWIVLNSVLRDV